jgi:hypothetical protein
VDLVSPPTRKKLKEIKELYVHSYFCHHSDTQNKLVPNRHRFMDFGIAEIMKYNFKSYDRIMNLSLRQFGMKIKRS